MTFLDTDHLTLLKYPENPRYATLVARMEASADQEIGTTIVSVEEQWRGWLAVIARFRDVDRQVAPYRELMELLDALQRWKRTWPACCRHRSNDLPSRTGGRQSVCFQGTN